MTNIHIVAFDVPCPANYGGVIDIFYKVRALAAQGVKIKLHCFQYGRERAEELERMCEKVYYYSRRTFVNPFYGKVPYIVNSRNSSELLDQLCQDEAPILFEGLHCTFHLDSPQLINRIKIVRTHNIEHHYYKRLERAENKYFKKYFFRIEAERLKKYQQILKHADLIAAISPSDYDYFSKRFESCIYLPAFHENDNVTYPGGRGDFVLYHGNLGVAENYEAALQLVEHVFSKLQVRCIIAGNNPPTELRKSIDRYEHIELRSEVTSSYISNLIELAHVNVLHTNQSTGIKLKLLNALYRGKFAVVNPVMVRETGLDALCSVAHSFEEMRSMILIHLEEDYPESMYLERKAFMDQRFEPQQSARVLLQAIDTLVQKDVVELSQ